MNQIFYKRRCKCKEEFLLKKKKSTPRRRRRKTILKYPDSIEACSITFLLNYEQKLSLNAKLLLNSFQKKYFYHAVDDILYLPNSTPSEQENLLALLYSPVLALQNNLFVDFFNIWIYEIYVDESVKQNRFLTSHSAHVSQSTQIAIKIVYETTVPVEKPDSYW